MSFVHPNQQPENNIVNVTLISKSQAGIPLLAVVALSFSLNTTRAGLISHWKLDEPSGTTAFDSAGSNDGATSGALVNQTGQLGTAYSFDGINDLIDTGANLGGAVMTVSAWVNVDFFFSTSVFPTIIGSSDPSRTVGWGLLYAGGSGSRWAFVNSASNFAASAAITSDAELGRGVWQHLVGVSNGSASQLYIDGVLVGTGVGDGTYTAPTNDIRIGQNADLETFGFSTHFRGLIDDVAIWDEALTSTEIEQLYNNGLQGIDAGGTATVVPEPSTLVYAFLAGLTLIGFRCLQWRDRTVPPA